MIKRLIKRILYAVLCTLPSSMVLMLHRITEHLDEQDSCSLTRQKFDFLLSRYENWTTLDDIVVNKRKHKISLTFDDGYADIYETVYPLCRAKNIPFTIFVTYGLLNSPGYLTKEQLLELSKDPLVTIGSHDIRHVPLPSISCDEQNIEITGSKTMIEELIGKPVKYLAYPYGQRNKATLKILKNMKTPYTGAFLAGGSCYNWAFCRNRYLLPRLFVSNSLLDSCIAKIDKYIVRSR